MTLDELAAQGKLESTPDTLRKFGFRAAHLADEETAYDLARLATGKLLRRGRTNPQDIDVIFYASALEEERPRTRRDPMAGFDYAASRLQYEMGMTRAVTIGVSQAGCASLFSAIRLARDLLLSEPDVNRVLCVASDVLPPHSRRDILFNLISDGACAALVERGSAVNRILSYAQVTKGSYWQPRQRKYEIIATYFPTAAAVIAQALAQAGVDRSEISLVIPHNVSAESWKILLRLAGIPSARLFRSNIGTKGHTIAADPMINLADATSRKRIRSGQRLLLFTFGFGAHWASMVLEH